MIGVYYLKRSDFDTIIAVMGITMPGSGRGLAARAGHHLTVFRGVGILI